jgi:membrane-bound lytic murein transglycosylase B
VIGSPPSQADLEPRPRRRVGELIGRVALVLLLLVFAAAAAWAFGAMNRPPDTRVAPPFQIPLQRVDPGSVVPGGQGQVPVTGQPDAPAGQSTSGADSLDAWARRVAEKTDIPQRAVRAYAMADLAMRSQSPSCRISWATLAGIGRVESHHGTIGGARLGDDGRPSKPIIGVALDGGPGVQAIKDTDGGTLDGDPTWDRAVGPMQFIPSTWVRYAMRANGDGNPPDPQNIDDSALTAARYLCSGEGDLATGEGWWAALMTYNNSVEYGRNVFSGADAYARASAV